MKQDTFLPLFTGYYHSIFDESERFIESEIDMSDSELKEHYSEIFEAGVTPEYFRDNFCNYINYKEAENGASEYIASALIDLDHSDIILGVEYQSTESPKYYNFSTDSINVEIDYDPKKLKEFIKDNLTYFEEYIKAKYTSRDGFISSYSNDPKDWIESIYNNDLGEHELGSVLEFVFQIHYGSDNEGSYALYEASNCYEGFMNSVEFDENGMIEAYKKSLKTKEL